LNSHFVINSGIMRIVIIRPGALGDTLMLAPALAEMKGRGDVTLIARTPGLDILRPFFRQGMDYEKGGWHRLFMDDPPRMPGMEKVDQVIAFLSDRNGNIKENLAVLMPAASVHVFPPFPGKGEPVHTALYLARCMLSSGCPVNPEKAIEAAIQYPLLRGGPFLVPGAERKIVFHPGSGGTAKNHSRDFWASLLQGFSRAVSEKAPLAVLLGPAEESSLSFYRERLRGQEAEIVFSPEMGPLLGLLKNAPLYVGHDSGITHLAAMLGTPTIALFRNSSAEQWEPLGPRVKVIEKENSPDLMEEVYERARAMVP
jgi:hypothetical protein